MAFPDTDLDIIIKAYVGADPNDDPGSWPTPVDWSSRRLDRDITVTRGRRTGQNTAASGSCTFWPDDHDLDLSTSDLTGTPVSLEVDDVGTSPPYGRFHGYIVDVASEVIPGSGGGTTVVKVTLGGILRRLGQGAVAKSALRRTVLGENITGPDAYWPMEADVGAQSSSSAISAFISPVVGCPDLRFTQSDHLIPGGYDQAIGWGSLPIATWESYRNDGLSSYVVDGPATAAVPSMTQGTLAVGLVFAGTTGKPAATTLVEFDLTGGGNYTLLRIGIYASTIDGVLSDQYGVEAVLIDNVTPALQTVGFDAPGDDGPQPLDGHPHAIWFTAVQSGGNVNLSLLVDDQLYTATATSVTLGRPTNVRVGGVLTFISLGGGEDSGDGSDFAVSVGHVAVWDSVPSIDFHSAMTGYAGEQAHVGIERVCDEEGIPYSSSATVSQSCGPQPIADVLAVIRDRETIDHGILGEDISTWGLTYRAGRQRYGQDARFTIDLATYRVAEGAARNVLRPARNDQRLRNEWTISRPAGGSVTVKDDVSIAKRGRYNDAATVNVASDDQLTNEASWRVHEGTYDGRRWGSAPVDFGANVAFLPDWLDAELGDRLDRTGHSLSYLERLDLQGYTEYLRRLKWRADLFVEPYAIFDTGTYAADVATATKRYDTLLTTTAEALDATETGVEISNAGSVRWGTATPYDITIGGEQMTVTAVADTPFSIAEDFEDTSFDVSFTTVGGTSAWARSSTQAHAGSWSFAHTSAAGSDDASAVCAVPVGATTLTFWRRGNGDANHTITVLVDGAVVFGPFTLSSTTWLQHTIDVTGGTSVAILHTETFTGGNTLWIDDVEFSGTNQTLTVTRSVNGVVKSHASGTQVRIAPALRGTYGL